MSHSNIHPNPPAVELITEPIRNIQRKRYHFLIQTKYLSERQIFAEAFLRGLVCGQADEAVTREQRSIIDNQLRCDYEKWCQTGQDLTPLFMNHRATVSETVTIIEEVFTEIARLEASGAHLMAIGAQLDFGVSCLRRTMIGEEEVNVVRRMIQHINQKLAARYQPVKVIRKIGHNTYEVIDKFKNQHVIDVRSMKDYNPELEDLLRTLDD
ncbi:hypothetical protein ACKWTF_013553 [Chironomus riparius]